MSRAKPLELTPERRAALPSYAREYIAKVERERDDAVRGLKRATDETTPSPIYVEDHLALRDGPTRQYIQATKIDIEHGDVSLAIRLTDNGRRGQKVIEMQWGGRRNYDSTDIVLQPRSFNLAWLFNANHSVAENPWRDDIDGPDPLV